VICLDGRLATENGPGLDLHAVIGEKGVWGVDRKSREKWPWLWIPSIEFGSQKIRRLDTYPSLPKPTSQRTQRGSWWSADDTENHDESNYNTLNAPAIWKIEFSNTLISYAIKHSVQSILSLEQTRETRQYVETGIEESRQYQQPDHESQPLQAKLRHLRCH
jgi:hypothetical protein